MPTPSTMRAVQYASFGAPATVVSLPVPKPAKGEVLVRVKCAAINPIDYKVRWGGGVRGRRRRECTGCGAAWVEVGARARPEHRGEKRMVIDRHVPPPKKKKLPDRKLPDRPRV